MGKLYEQITHKSLRSTLVDFYNRHFVSEIQEKIPMALMEKVVILKKGVLMFTGEHIDEERSIFDMFGWIIYFIFFIINYLSPLSILHKADRNKFTLIKAFLESAITQASW